jgi:hypothetical protein
MNCEKVVDVYDFLESNNMLQPGKHISSDILTDLIGEYDVESIRYIGPIISLCKRIQRKTGTFCKMSQNGITIFVEDECVPLAKKRCHKAERINEESYDVMKRTDLAAISTQEKRKEHVHRINILLTLNRKTRLILEEVE